MWNVLLGMGVNYILKLFYLSVYLLLKLFTLTKPTVTELLVFIVTYVMPTSSPDVSAVQSYLYKFLSFFQSHEYLRGAKYNTILWYSYQHVTCQYFATVFFIRLPLSAFPTHLAYLEQEQDMSHVQFVHPEVLLRLWHIPNETAPWRWAPISGALGEALK